MNRKTSLYFFTLIFFIEAHAQNSSFFNYSSIGGQYYLGTSIGNTFNRIRDSRPYSGEIYYQRQTNPGPAWNNTKRLPQWGVALSATHTGSKYVGSIVCLYPYIKSPLLTVGAWESNLRIGFGIGWVQ